MTSRDFQYVNLFTPRDALGVQLFKLPAHASQLFAQFRVFLDHPQVIATGMEVELLYMLAGAQKEQAEMLRFVDNCGEPGTRCLRGLKANAQRLKFAFA